MAALYREFRIVSPAVWVELVSFIKASGGFWKDAEKPLRIIVTRDDKRRNAEQNARYWKLLSMISEQAWVSGKQFDKEVWHEMFARLYLPLHEVVLPDGEIIQRRETTTKLSVGEFSEFMSRVEAHAATELGVEFL